MRTLEEIKRTVETGLGRFPCDLKLANVQLVNVFSGEIYPTDIYIQNKRVVSIEPGLTLEAEKNVDCGGAYAVPGFIDSHMHFESTMLSPEALATVVVPQGTTTLCADLMEIANVAGEEGLRAMLTCMDRLPYRMLGQLCHIGAVYTEICKRYRNICLAPAEGRLHAVVLEESVIPDGRKP